MNEDRSLKLRSAAGITWVKDADQLLLVEGDGKRSWMIRGAEAAIWDLLILGYRFDKIVRFLSILLNMPAEEAKAALLATLQTWETAGIVQAAGGTRHG